MSAPTAAAPATPRGLPPGWRSLRAKAVLSFIAVVLYFVGAGGVLSLQRDRMISTVEDLERLNQVESTMARVNAFASQAILKIHGGGAEASPARVIEAAELDIESAAAGLSGLGTWYDGAEAMQKLLDYRLAEARRGPSPQRLAELRAAMQRLSGELDRTAREVRGRHDLMWGDYRATYDSITLTAALLFLLGIAVFGGIVMVFFRRLAWDVRALSERAVQVVRGYRGKALPVTRSDEVGALMEAVNEMQQILREREQQLEVARQERFHQEKMVAIGSLAAAVAHEINNPIAAIEGVAQSIHLEAQTRCGGEGPCRPELILEHTRRIVGITRQLSQLSSPQSTEPEWTDLNALARATCTFVTYDPRFRDVKMELALDAAIPAVWAVADHVTQILMNLLINAADALRTASKAERRIDVATTLDGHFVRLTVADNANGIPPEIAGHVFEEGFTTKEYGTGIGLFMCRTLAERGGGRIGLESRPGAGTTVALHLPTQTPREH